MTYTELITPPRAASPPEPWSESGHEARPAASAHPSSGELLDETLPLVGAVPVYGPPIVLLAGPWLLLALALAGPFALVLTFVVVLVAAAALVALIGAIIAAPFLLVRRLRGYRATHASMRAPVAPLVTRESRWGTA